MKQLQALNMASVPILIRGSFAVYFSDDFKKIEGFFFYF